MKVLFILLLITFVYLSSCEAMMIHVKCTAYDENCSAIVWAEERAIKRRSLIPFDFFSDFDYNYGLKKQEKSVKKTEQKQTLPDNNCNTKSCIINNILTSLRMYICFNNIDLIYLIKKLQFLEHRSNKIIRINKMSLTCVGDPYSNVKCIPVNGLFIGK